MQLLYAQTAPFVFFCCSLTTATNVQSEAVHKLRPQACCGGEEMRNKPHHHRVAINKSIVPVEWASSWSRAHRFAVRKYSHSHTPGCCCCCYDSLCNRDRIVFLHLHTNTSSMQRLWWIESQTFRTFHRPQRLTFWQFRNDCILNSSLPRST